MSVLLYTVSQFVRTEVVMAKPMSVRKSLATRRRWQLTGKDGGHPFHPAVNWWELPLVRLFAFVPHVQVTFVACSRNPATGFSGCTIQCGANFFYSKEQAETAEKPFWQSETAYENCVKLIRAGKPSSPADHFSLIFTIFDFHARNAIYANNTGKEGFYAYELRMALLFREMLLGRKEGDVDDADVFQHFRQYWRVRILSTSAGSGLLTTDNPALLFALTPHANQIDMAMLPITPYHLAVAFDNRIVRVQGNQMTPNDEALVNQLQIGHTYSCVYCDQPFDETEQQFVANNLGRKTGAKPSIDEVEWVARVVRLPRNMQLSFLQFCPPLL